MSEITVLGLGLMGAALARTLYTAGFDITVWNRSPDRMRSFAEQGVATVRDVAAATAASPTLVICIDNYTSTASLLDVPDIRPLLAGRTIVQFSSGTPKEAREAADVMWAAGAAYLDGKLLCGPPAIGTEQACIRVSGDPTAYESAGAFLIGRPRETRGRLA